MLNCSLSPLSITISLYSRTQRGTRTSHWHFFIVVPMEGKETTAHKRPRDDHQQPPPSSPTKQPKRQCANCGAVQPRGGEWRDCDGVIFCDDSCAPGAPDYRPAGNSLSQSDAAAVEQATVYLANLPPRVRAMAVLRSVFFDKDGFTELQPDERPAKRGCAACGAVNIVALVDIKKCQECGDGADRLFDLSWCQACGADLRLMCEGCGDFVCNGFHFPMCARPAREVAQRRYMNGKQEPEYSCSRCVRMREEEQEKDQDEE